MGLIPGDLAIDVRLRYDSAMRNLLITAAIALAGCGRPQPAESPPAAPEAVESASTSSVAGQALLNVVVPRLESWRRTVVATYSDGTIACGFAVLGHQREVFYVNSSDVKITIWKPGQNSQADACTRNITPAPAWPAGSQ
jgi:predicted small lipoprotein YifL